MKTKIASFLAIVGFMALSASAFAQAVTGSASGSTGLLAGLMPVLTPILALLVTSVVKTYAPHLPGWLLPVVASLTGAISTYVANLAGGLSINPVEGLLLGLAATGLHQISSQLKPDASAPASPQPPPAAAS